jgi:hypothetical protein
MEIETNYLYVGKDGRRELRIPFSQITVRELLSFEDAIVDGDDKIVRVQV